MDIILGVIAGLIILTVLVVIHELGHAIVARRNGVRVEEFGVGFPPRAKVWKVKNSFLGRDVEYSLNWLPIGGFVRLQGEHDEDGGQKEDFGRASFWAKTKIMLAGVAVNWVAAAVLLTGLSLYGIPQLLPNQFSIASDTQQANKTIVVASVQDDSPAAAAGLKAGDILTSIDGQRYTDVETAIAAVKQRAGDTVRVSYKRDGTQQQTTATLRDASAAKSEGHLGAGLGQQGSLRSTWSAPIVGIGLTGQLTYETVKGLGQTVQSLAVGTWQKMTGSGGDAGSKNLQTASAGVTGPVGLIGQVLPRLIEMGPAYVVLISAIISLSLAVFNTLPIPGLDGGRWALIALYRLRKQPLTKDREETIVGVGMLVLLGLVVLITISDVMKIAS